ncbi:MAG: dienelactone hydrolase family protein [Acidimicrobiia bacterium]|nr:dienelactone hydrolase family protein [Acidimicrobiia bacterium]
MVTTRTESITVDGGSFSAHVALPDSGSGPGLLILQEIFGVNSYIRSVCARVAQMGYLALAPDMFWRQQPDFIVEPDQGDDGMQSAFAMMGGFDWSQAPGDLGAALGHLRGLPECTGEAGVMGFCFGGTLTFHVAADHDPACAISYYGSGVADALDAKADQVSCPVLFHFGSDDPYLPIEDVDRIRARFADATDVTIEVQPGAGHAFDNDFNPLFSNPEAAAAAWAATAAFLAGHLPPSAG